MEPFFNTCFPLLKEVKDGTRKNWRHDVFNGKRVLMDGRRVMRHHLNWLNSDNGDFKPEILDLILKLLAEYNPNMHIYNSVVLTPTLIYWATVVLADISPAEARFYLANGGKHNIEASYKLMERKACELCVCLKMSDRVAAVISIRSTYIPNYSFSEIIRIVHNIYDAPWKTLRVLTTIEWNI